jgi:hypothetical protein
MEKGKGKSTAVVLTITKHSVLAGRTSEKTFLSSLIYLRIRTHQLKLFIFYF